MLQNIPKEKILEVVRQGPTIPQKIVKIVGGDTMLIGAILSTMISTGEVKYSILKIGGSPLYYVPEHEEKLEEYVHYLNEKDQKTVRTLKEQKIMQDSLQDPLTRFSLKTIRDFAKQFEIEYNNKKELFYRYFLVPKDEAEPLAKEMLKASQPKEEPKIEQTQTTQEVMLDGGSSALDKAAAIHHAVSKDSVDIQKTPEPVVPKKTVSKHEPKTDFFETIKEHIHKMNLDIISREKVKKSEYTLVLKNHDSNEYIYCVAKDKKTINEGDLSTAFVFSHQKRMSCIFLMTGHLTKKAESMAEKEFKDMKIERI